MVWNPLVSKGFLGDDLKSSFSLVQKMLALEEEGT